MVEINKFAAGLVYHFNIAFIALSVLLAAYDGKQTSSVLLVLIIGGNFTSCLNLAMRDFKTIAIPIVFGFVMAVLYGAAIVISCLSFADVYDVGQFIISSFCGALGMFLSVMLTNDICNETGSECGCFACLKSRCCSKFKTNQVSPVVVGVKKQPTRLEVQGEVAAPADTPLEGSPHQNAPEDVPV